MSVAPRPDDRLHPTVRQYVDNPAIARTYDAHFATNALFAYDCAFLDAHLERGCRVLDAGCGTGRHLTYLTARGFHAVGLDLSPHMLREASANLAACGAPARLVRADFHALPLRDGAVFGGVLLMFSTLGLIHEPESRRELLASLRGHLGEDGVLLAHVHNRRYRSAPGGFARAGMFRRRTAEAEEAGDTVMPNYRGLQDLYLHAFDDEELRLLLRDAGYRIREMRYLNALRNGPYRGPDPSGRANGFLVAAVPR